MDRQIINFSANEQSLIKTSGTDHYAGNVVRYIEAHFDLGANWTGYDSVRAIWRNKRDVTRYSTVLSSEGVCIVPYEVLTMRGDVCMNLVGSIVENDVLVDRLTTYPMCALTVDVPAMVDGSDPASITPSEYEQFVASVRNDANRAEAGATASEASASEASALAEQATASAESASGSANQASESATASAQSAEASAESAQSAQNHATSAETAKDEAESARDKILSMRATAETLEPNQSATASYSDGVLTLGIPRGQKGDTGEKGGTGETGATPSFSIGNVETLEPNESATATITGDAENPVLNLGIPQGKTGEVSYEDLASLLPRDTASGSLVTIPDGQNIIPVESLKVSLEPIQDLHGYDKPWAEGAGVNKFDGIWNGASSGYNIATNLIPVIEGGTYYTCTPNLTSDRVYGTLYDANGDLVQDNFILGRNQTFTVPSGVAFVRPKLWYDKDTTNMAINYPSTVTTYSPYSNICPIDGWTEVNTYRTGKNLLNPNLSAWFARGSYRYINDVVPKGATARLTFTDKDRSVNTSDIYFGWVYENLTEHAGSPQYYSWVLQGASIKSDTTNHSTNTGVSMMCQNLFIYPNTEDVFNRLFARYDIMVELGTEATSYEPYIAPITYTTDLGRTVYGGTLDVVSGELVVDRAMVDMGTLTWNKTSTYMYAPVPGKRVSLTAGIPNNIMSNKYASTDVIIASSNLEDGYMTEGYGNYSNLINVRDDSLIDKTVAEIKTAMQGVQLVYELSTPQTIQLTPQEVSLLLGTNNVWSDGDVAMVYSADVARWVEKKLGQ